MVPAVTCRREQQQVCRVRLIHYTVVKHTVKPTSHPHGLKVNSTGLENNSFLGVLKIFIWILRGRCYLQGSEPTQSPGRRLSYLGRWPTLGDLHQWKWTGMADPCPHEARSCPEGKSGTHLLLFIQAFLLCRGFRCVSWAGLFMFNDLHLQAFILTCTCIIIHVT